MNSLFYDICGYLGGGILAIVFIPQVYKTVITNKTEDISITSISLNIFASTLYIPYCFYYMLWPIIISNTTILICQIIILYYCIKNYKNTTILPI